jgi:hypothetical protein
MERELCTPNEKTEYINRWGKTAYKVSKCVPKIKPLDYDDTLPDHYCNQITPVSGKCNKTPHKHDINADKFNAFLGWEDPSSASAPTAVPASRGLGSWFPSAPVPAPTKADTAASEASEEPSKPSALATAAGFVADLGWRGIRTAVRAVSSATADGFSALKSAAVEDYQTYKGENLQGIKNILNNELAKIDRTYKDNLDTKLAEINKTYEETLEARESNILFLVTSMKEQQTKLAELKLELSANMREIAEAKRRMDPSRTTTSPLPLFSEDVLQEEKTGSSGTDMKSNLSANVQEFAEAIRRINISKSVRSPSTSLLSDNISKAGSSVTDVATAQQSGIPSEAQSVRKQPIMRRRGQ